MTCVCHSYLNVEMVYQSYIPSYVPPWSHFFLPWVDCQEWKGGRREEGIFKIPKEDYLQLWLSADERHLTTENLLFSSHLLGRPNSAHSQKGDLILPVCVTSSFQGPIRVRGTFKEQVHCLMRSHPYTWIFVWHVHIQTHCIRSTPVSAEDCRRFQFDVSRTSRVVAASSLFSFSSPTGAAALSSCV